jgi:arginine N-succinyltransferase
MVIAQHGTRESPCTFLDVTERETYSSTIDRHFRHPVLSIGFHFDGPTEIGGLVVDPAARGGPGEPGKQLSYVRFLYMAVHPDRFRETVLAELMPPLRRDGKSVFWESFGRRFTGLDYQDADKRSRQGKEFIQQLFPATEFYATLLPPGVQRMLGKVGSETEGARRMLSRLGFRYVNRIDPFDGGPHYEAKLAEVTLVREHRALPLADAALPAATRDREFLAGVVRAVGPERFRAVRTRARVASGRVRLPDDAVRALGARPGDVVHLVPFA